MNIRYLSLLVVLSVISFSACKKSGENCPAKANVSVTANYTSITEGWDLNLSVNYNSLYKYVWIGPNGWTMQASGATVTRTNVQLQDAGMYYVKAYSTSNCEVQEGSLAITVTTVQNAPCEGTLANNTCTSDVPGLSSFTFNSVNLGYNTTNNSSQVSCYIVPPAPGNPSMTFTFTGHNKPKPGLYKTIFGFNVFGKEDECSFYFHDPNSGKIYIASGGQNVYVTLVNGKTQICFCNTEVRDAPSGNLKTASGKLTIGN
jgi:hypothetical protein